MQGCGHAWHRLISDGTWRSLVAHLLWEQGVASSNLAVPIVQFNSATPIAGTFSNLPDGAIVNMNGNNLQASYEGDGGNDLILTVVP